MRRKAAGKRYFFCLFCSKIKIVSSIRKDAANKVQHYIENLPGWSKDICLSLRQVILSADASITEDWKWGPNYNSNGMICGYGAFQKHVKVTFFNGHAMKDGKKLFNHCLDNEFCRSIKYTAVTEINEKVLSDYIKESAAINKSGFKKEISRKGIEVPVDLQQALSENQQAQRFFEGLSYSYKKEFAEYVATAKQEKTKLERIAKVIKHCAEGKKLNEKYKTRKAE